jgi:hypothetical protein
MITRPSFVRAALAGGLTSYGPLDALASVPQTVQSDITLPLNLCGGAYCVEYSIDGQRFRAVADTGSPFLLVDGSSVESPWGCYRGTGGSTGLDDTDELFGGEDVSVQWRSGKLELHGQDGASRVVPEITFGIVRASVGKGGGGAIFLGLAKRRKPRIRPTFLEQLNAPGASSSCSLSFSFLRRALTISTRPQIPSVTDAVPLLDLRSRGAPIASYACRVRRLWVNGAPIQLDRPTVAVIDTGTTGISVSESLYCSSVLPPRWSDARVELTTESGKVCALEASARRRPKPTPFGDVPLVDVPADAPEASAFPLIVTSVSVPWFEEGFGSARFDEREAADARLDALLEPYAACEARVARTSRRTASRGELFSRLDGLGERPHVLFVGLAFLWRRELTVDVDAGRMTIV